MEKAPQNLELILQYFNEFTSRQIDQLAALDHLYKEWNSKINVISRKDIDSLYEKHILHSLSIAAFTSFNPGSAILDLGTGGGFPGIPLAIFFPDVSFHLADSINKKLRVVEEVASALQLKNISTQHTRAEQITNRKFNFVVSRAVAPLKDLWEWSKPLLKERRFNGKANESIDPEHHPLPSGLICLKGGDLKNEIADSKTRPLISDIARLFKEEYFREKYLLYVPS